MRRSLIVVALAAALTACLGTTGNQIVSFTAAVAGPADAVAGQPLEFISGLGWHVVLTKATLHVGAIYLDQTLPASGGGAAPCFLQGTYVAQATTGPDATAGIDVDVLSPLSQPFPDPAVGTDLLAQAGQVWLTGVQVDQVDDPTPILHVEGTADQGGQVYDFLGTLTIGRNRVVTPTNSALPGTDPICHQRIVSPILVNIVPRSGGTLVLRVDPRQLFVDVDFSMLQAFPNDPGPPEYVFRDDSKDEPSALLYSALHSAGSLYAFTWSDP